MAAPFYRFSGRAASLLRTLLDGPEPADTEQEDPSKLEALDAEISKVEEDNLLLKHARFQAKPEEHTAGLCIECEDQPADTFCIQCDDEYCKVCFAAQHRRGKRAKHTTRELQINGANGIKPTRTTSEVKEASASAPSAELAAAAAPAPAPEPEEENEPLPSATPMETDDLETLIRGSRTEKPQEDSEDDSSNDEWNDGENQQTTVSTATTLSVRAEVATPSPRALMAQTIFVEKARYVPVRLGYKDRKTLRLIEAALNVSEYTDKVDVIKWRNKAQRIHKQLQDICAILSGLVVATDYNTGKKLVVDREFKDNAQFFRDIFEIGRRYKVMNPEKMRGEYGKLVYLLQDSANPVIQEMLQFDMVAPITTVYSLLESGGGTHSLGVLSDPLISTATAEISPHGKSRPQIQREIKQKERAIETLAKRYAHGDLDEEGVKLCLYSLGDHHTYLAFNRDPVDLMIRHLTTMFHPERVEEGYSLAIAPGMGTARLAHSHERQYYYVLQSLALWREIMSEMFKLWWLADTDLLSSDNPYRLSDTGQGLNRVQSAPRVGRAMREILHKVQSAVGGWVGSSVIHLGDHNVPNALMFIDKYVQVPRILNPIVCCLRELERLVRVDRGVAQYVEQAFGGAERLKKDILCDFFRFAFDGSGADNFFDAGSCIDGRLTSAWNWCSLLEKKPFYPIFKLTGFSGFDGSFQK